MEKIKFRVWNEHLQIMEYCSLTTLLDGYKDECYYTPTGESVGMSNCPAMQYTGFRDKSGKEIYKGDVYYCSFLHRNIVINDIRVARWVIEEDRMNNPTAGIEIIGNIYANPELLKRR